MGYSNVNAQLLTVPGQPIYRLTCHERGKADITAVYVWGATVFMVVAYYSDKIQMRSPFIVLGLSLNIIGQYISQILVKSSTYQGYIILATVESVGGRYFALYIVAGGLYITPGLNVTWIGEHPSPSLSPFFISSSPSAGSHEIGLMMGKG